MTWTLKQARENDRKYPAPKRPRGGRYSEDALIDRAQLIALVDRLAAMMARMDAHVVDDEAEDACADDCPGCDADELREEIGAGR